MTVTEGWCVYESNVSASNATYISSGPIVSRAGMNVRFTGVHTEGSKVSTETSQTW